MRPWASILALLPGLALAQTPLTTADDWQSAVQTAAPSSWFAFAAGTYTTTGTALTVTSGWTRIQGAGPGQSYLTQGHATNWGVVRLTGPKIVLDGFTVYGGSTSNYGGGVQGTGWQTVTNCHVVSNSAKVGGGFYLVDLHNSTVAHNFAYGYIAQGQSGAGGVLGASNVARQCVVSNNSALYDGGGLAGIGATYAPLVDDCDIIDNSARDGGGLYYVTATNCRVWRNSATNANFQGGGGGKAVYLYSCSVISNAATKNGGGVYNCNSARDTVFAHNEAKTAEGGGGYNLFGTNLTVRDNVAATIGGGLCCGLAASSVIERNVANGNGGGGAWDATLVYSLIVSNRAAGASGAGGGVAGGTVESCAFVDNWCNASTVFGGQDSFNSSLVNCTVINTNAAPPVKQYSLTPSRPVANVLIVHATATQILDNTSAVWTNVAANYFTNSADGLFLPDDPPYRLPPDSPLIDAGSGDFVSYPFDLWGRDRTHLGGDPDIGATEWTATDLPPDNGAARKRRIIGLLFGKDN